MHYTVDSQPHTLSIDVKSGYTTDGQSSISNECATNLNTLRIQQRLNYLGFPGADAKPLVVGADLPTRCDIPVEIINGQIVERHGSPTNTHWAIGLFTAAVDKLPRNDNANFYQRRFSDTSLSFVNARNPPQWIEFKKDLGFVINPTSTPTGTKEQTERWGTSWAYEVLQSAGLNYELAGARETLKFQGNSLPIGGNTKDHYEHEDGRAIDVEIDGAQNSIANKEPFFIFESFNDVDTFTNEFTIRDLIVDKEGRVIIYEDGKYGFVSLSQDRFRRSLQLQRALTIQDAWDDEAVLNAIQRMIVSRPAYSLDKVRSQIGTFGNVVTPSGAKVSRILNNDPRLWQDPTLSIKPKLSVGHGGHFHVDFKRPPSLGGEVYLNELNEGIVDLARWSRNMNAPQGLGATLPIVGTSLADAVNMPQLLLDLLGIPS